MKNQSSKAEVRLPKGQTGACGCRADEFEYQDCMSGYWYLQHRKSCPLRRQYEESKVSGLKSQVGGKAEARTSTMTRTRTRRLTAEERDDLQAEKDLLVDMIETIDLLLVHLKHGIQLHRNTGTMKRGLTDLEFARKMGMVARSSKLKVKSSNSKGRRGSHPSRVSRAGNGV